MTNSVDFLLVAVVGCCWLLPVAIWIERKYGAVISRVLRME